MNCTVAVSACEEDTVEQVSETERKTEKRLETVSYFPSMKKVLRESLKLLEYFTNSFFSFSSA